MRGALQQLHLRNVMYGDSEEMAAGFVNFMKGARGGKGGKGKGKGKGGKS